MAPPPDTYLLCQLTSSQAKGFGSSGSAHLTPNDEDHRPPPETGVGSQSSVRTYRRIQTETRGGGSCGSTCSASSLSTLHAKRPHPSYTEPMPRRRLAAVNRAPPVSAEIGRASCRE